MLKANYHTHTFRCGHAGSFKDEEYVQKAIEAQFQTLGFSDHIMLPGFEQYKYRGNFDMCQNYYNSINSLKEKYKDQIMKDTLANNIFYNENRENYVETKINDKTIDIDVEVVK